MPDPTPGQVAYEALVRAGYPDMAADATDLWHTLTPALKRAWEAAAQAVLAPRLTDQAGKMHLLLAYLLDHATGEDLDALHLWLTDATARLHAAREDER